MYSLQAKYLFEREGISTFEAEAYFFTYKVIENEFHVFDICIEKSLRRTDLSFKVARHIEDLGREHKCTLLVGYIQKESTGREASLSFQFKNGMRLHNWNEKEIILVKDL